MERLIEEGKYKGFEYKIKFATGDGWSDWKDKFFVETVFPLSKNASKDIQTLRSSIKSDIDKWLADEPKTEKDWVDLVSECVIQTGYEYWHVDPKMAMNVLQRYAKFKNRNVIDK